MSQVTNASPRSILLGIDDKSKREVAYEPTSLPIHLPHVFSYAAWGPTDPQLVVGSTMIKVYGAETFEVRSPYINHQYPLIATMRERANATVFQRIKPDDAAPPATLTLSMDILETEITQYERFDDGTWRLDAQGARIPTGTTVPGYKWRWIVSFAADGVIGQATKVPGTLGVAGGDQSVVVPILDFQTSFFGKRGNDRGLRLWAPTMLSRDRVNSRVVEDQLAQLYRIQFVERESARANGTVVRSLEGAEYADFSFREDVIDTATGVEYGLEATVLDQWRNSDLRNGAARKWGPFDSMHVYRANLEEILDDVYAAEKLANPDILQGDGAENLINLFTGIYYTGAPHYAAEVLGALDGGDPLVSGATYYADGGTDGTMSKALFDAAVGNICLHYEDGEWPLTDTAKYPQSIIYDTGFALNHKYSLLTPIGVRKDLFVVLSTQDVSLPQNSASEESAIAAALQTRATMTPESEYYGTSVVRAAIVGHSGWLLDSKYRNLVPMTVDLSDKLSLWAGAGTGILNNAKSPDVNPNNVVTKLRDVNLTFKTETVRNKDWSNGLIWVQSFDHEDALFYPAMQTAYPYDTSVLNSVPTGIICVELEKVCDRVWRMLSGRSDLTNEQFIQRSNELITSYTENRFGQRVTVVPDTYMTAQDTARGYSWSCRVKLYAGGMKTVGTFTIEAHRIEELA